MAKDIMKGNPNKAKYALEASEIDKLNNVQEIKAYLKKLIIRVQL